MGIANYHGYPRRLTLECRLDLSLPTLFRALITPCIPKQHTST